MARRSMSAGYWANEQEGAGRGTMAALRLGGWTWVGGCGMELGGSASFSAGHVWGSARCFRRWEWAAGRRRSGSGVCLLYTSPSPRD
eukprot:2260024-Alexandrium_andersonii.AAC.1